MNRVTVWAQTHTFSIFLSFFPSRFLFPCVYVIRMHVCRYVCVLVWLDRSRECASIREFICSNVSVYVLRATNTTTITIKRIENFIMQYKRTFYMLRRIRSSVVTFATPKNIIRFMYATSIMRAIWMYAWILGVCGVYSIHCILRMCRMRFCSMCVNINRNSSYEMNTTHQTQQTEENMYVKMFRKNAVIPDNTYMQEYTAHWNPFLCSMMKKWFVCLSLMR